MSYLVLVGIGMCAAVLKALVGWDVKLVGEEEQGVASVAYTFCIWFQACDFYDLYDPFLTGGDEELNEKTRVRESSGFCSYVSLIYLHILYVLVHLNL